ncbi:hypothetical protein R80B4_00027 [Fibrobacteres bacterium R8-0-B4]
MSKKYGFGVKLAAAALAVAGVAGITTAALPTVIVVGQAQTLTASVVVENIAELTATKNAGADLIRGYDAYQKPDLRDPGNFGTIKVRTNQGIWDVKMTTGHGGRLVFTEDGKETIVCDTAWDGSTSNCKPKTVGGTDHYLTYKPSSGLTRGVIKAAVNTNPDTVLLDVAIGMAKDGEALGVAAGQLFTIDAPAGASEIIAPVQMDSTSLVDSNKPAKAISFAKLIGNSYKATGTAPATNSNSAPAFDVGPEGGGNATPWNKVETDGFPQPAVNNTEYFYINVGILPDADKLIATKKGGTYEETFTFNLYTSW